MRLYAGPMLGNLQTMQPLADALNMREAVVVLPSMFEAQGAFDKGV